MSVNSRSFPGFPKVLPSFWKKFSDGRLAIAIPQRLWDCGGRWSEDRGGQSSQAFQQFELGYLAGRIVGCTEGFPRKVWHRESVDEGQRR
jgi:hypothetical protein